MESNRYDAKWDVFISYASEDMEAVAKPLAYALRSKGLRIWFDQFSLQVGDSLSQSINVGLARSKYGVVILSKHFLEKEWPQKELHGLFARDQLSSKVLIPVWHGIDAADLLSTYPILADRFALKASDGIDGLVEGILKLVNLPFFGRGVAGLWTGETGRLRIFEDSRGGYYGDYDWGGHEWAGHLRGEMDGRVIHFEWNWDFSEEKGAGFFFFSYPGRATYSGPSYTRLFGGWVPESRQGVVDREAVSGVLKSGRVFELGGALWEEILREKFPDLNLWRFVMLKHEYDSWSTQWAEE